MQTSKKWNPFTAFNVDYYNNLMLVNTKQAEEYRLQVTAPKEGGEDLWARRRAKLAKAWYEVYIHPAEKKRLWIVSDNKRISLLELSNQWAMEIDEDYALSLIDEDMTTWVDYDEDDYEDIVDPEINEVIQDETEELVEVMPIERRGRPAKSNL